MVLERSSSKTSVIAQSYHTSATRSCWRPKSFATSSASMLKRDACLGSEPRPFSHSLNATSTVKYCYQLRATTIASYLDSGSYTRLLAHSRNHPATTIDSALAAAHGELPAFGPGQQRPLNCHVLCASVRSAHASMLSWDHVGVCNRGQYEVMVRCALPELVTMMKRFDGCCWLTFLSHYS